VNGKWLRIEVYGDDRWQVSAEGEAPEGLDLGEVLATLKAYAGDEPARAVLDGAVIASTDPSAICLAGGCGSRQCAAYRNAEFIWGCAAWLFSP
jgi:hypothetical protein